MMIDVRAISVNSRQTRFSIPVLQTAANTRSPLRPWILLWVLRPCTCSGKFSLNVSCTLRPLSLISHGLSVFRSPHLGDDTRIARCGRYASLSSSDSFVHGSPLSPLGTFDHLSAPLWRCCDHRSHRPISWAHVSGRRLLGMSSHIAIGIVVVGVITPEEGELVTTGDIAIMPHPSAFARLNTQLVSTLKHGSGFRDYG